MPHRRFASEPRAETGRTIRSPSVPQLIARSDGSDARSSTFERLLRFGERRHSTRSITGCIRSTAIPPARLPPTFEISTGRRRSGPRVRHAFLDDLRRTRDGDSGGTPWIEACGGARSRTVKHFTGRSRITLRRGGSKSPRERPWGPPGPGRAEAARTPAAALRPRGTIRLWGVVATQRAEPRRSSVGGPEGKFHQRRSDEPRNSQSGRPALARA